MNCIAYIFQAAVVSQFHTMAKPLFGLLATGAILAVLSCTGSGQPAVEQNVDHSIGQAVFETPEDAAKSFVQAVADDDEVLLSKVLGADFREVLPLDQVTSKDVENFLNAWEKHHTLLSQDDKQLLIAVGEGKWTMPIPIVEGASGWYFDIDEGLERMRIRRIGRNELAAIQAVLAYYDAQMEYAEQDRDNDGILEYAQKFISTPGNYDGLYWTVESGDTLSPLGTLLADRTAGGGYHGYFYRILNAQGENAGKGAYSYLMGDQMRAGFALVAWPEEYGESGIMSFIVSHEGIVYQQDLGSNGAEIAEEMLSYDPGSGWVAVKEVDDPQAEVNQ